MIYASDLDRTLIYSESFLESNPLENKEDKILIDTSKVCSYIHKDVAAHLSFMIRKKKIRFIPVTTRSLAEYKRIRLKEVGIEPEYAITSNGGIILHNGKEVQEWKDNVYNNVKVEELISIKDYLDNLPEFNYCAKIVDNALIFTKYSKELIGKPEIKNRITELKKRYQQYNILVHKNKVYVVPKYVSKDNALNWLKQYINEDNVIASGDSAFDIPMLNIADLAIIPGHSDLGERDVKNKRCIKISSGIKSPLDTLKIIETSQI